MRNRTIGIMWVTALVAVAVATSTAAQQRGPRGGGRGGSGGWGRNSEYNRMYDPKTVETQEGEVVSVDYHTPRKASGRGVHLVLKTGKETIPVHLGPEWFIENQDTQIEKGDRVKAIGSRVTYEDKPALIAREVEKGDEVLQLRDEDGSPRWAGWHRRG